MKQIDNKQMPEDYLFDDETNIPYYYESFWDAEQTKIFEGSKQMDNEI